MAVFKGKDKPGPVRVQPGQLRHQGRGGRVHQAARRQGERSSPRWSAAASAASSTWPPAGRAAMALAKQAKRPVKMMLDRDGRAHHRRQPPGSLQKMRGRREEGRQDRGLRGRGLRHRRRHLGRHRRGQPGHLRRGREVQAGDAGVHPRRPVGGHAVTQLAPGRVRHGGHAGRVRPRAEHGPAGVPQEEHHRRGLPGPVGDGRQDDRLGPAQQGAGLGQGAHQAGHRHGLVDVDGTWAASRASSTAPSTATARSRRATAPRTSAPARARCWR